MKKQNKMKSFTIREVETVKTPAADYWPWECPIETLMSWLSGS